MKKAAFVGVLVCVGVMFLAAVALADQERMGYGMMGGSQTQGPSGPGWGTGYDATCQGWGAMGPGAMGPGMMGMMGPGMMGMMGTGMMGPGMMGAANPEVAKFLDETRDLRREMHMKGFDYMEALRNPKTTPEMIRKLRVDMKGLMLKLYEKSPVLE